MGTRRRTEDGQGEAAAPHLGRGSEVSVQARWVTGGASPICPAAAAPARHHRQPSEEAAGERVALAERVGDGGLRSDTDPDKGWLVGLNATPAAPPAVPYPSGAHPEEGDVGPDRGDDGKRPTDAALPRRRAVRPSS